MSGSSKAKSGKNRKYGRNKRWCEAYRMRGQRETNKKRKLRSRVKRFPNDKGAERALARLV